MPQFKRLLPKAKEGLKGVVDSGVWGKIGNWWRGYLPKQEAIEQVAKFEAKTDNIIDALRTSSPTMQKALGEKFVAFKNDITTTMTQLKRSFSKLNREKFAIQGELSQIKSEAKIIKDRIAQIDFEIKNTPPTEGVIVSKLNAEAFSLKTKFMSLKTAFSSKKASLLEASDKANYVDGLIKKVDLVEKKTSKNLIDGLDYIDDLERDFSQADASVLTELPNIRGLSSKIRSALKEMGPELQSEALQSQNLGKWKNFLKEYARIKTKDPAVATAWEANPENAKMLKSLLSHPNDKISDLAYEIKNLTDRKALKEFIGKSPRDVAYKLRVPLAAVSGVSAAGLGVVGWLSGQSSANVNNELKSISNQLPSLGATGPAAQEVSKLQTSLNAAASVWDKINKDFATNPEAVGESYLDELAKHMEDISEVDFDVISAGSKNKDAVTALQNKLGKVLGDKMSSFSSAVTGKVAEINENIKLVQQLLQKTNPAIKVTGILDSTTATALKRLEQLFNARAQDTEFTGKLVNENTGYIIGYNNLQEIIKRIKAY